MRRARLRTSAQAPAQHVPRARFIASAKLSISLVASDSLLYHQNVKLNNLNESLIVYGYNYLWRHEEKEQVIEGALELYLEKRRTTRLLTEHIPSKEKGDSTLELQDDKGEESLESDHDSEFDAFAKELDSN